MSENLREGRHIFAHQGLSPAVATMRGILRYEASESPPFLFSWQLRQMSSNFAKFWQKHTAENLKQTQYTQPTDVVKYLHTVPKKN